MRDIGFGTAWNLVMRNGSVCPRGAGYAHLTVKGAGPVAKLAGPPPAKRRRFLLPGAGARWRDGESRARPLHAAGHGRRGAGYGFLRVSSDEGADAMEIEWTDE